MRAMTFTRKVRYHFCMGLGSLARLITSELVFVKVYVRGQGKMTFQQLESQVHDYRPKPPAVQEPDETGICSAGEVHFSVYSVAS